MSSTCCTVCVIQEASSSTNLMNVRNKDAIGQEEQEIVLLHFIEQCILVVTLPVLSLHARINHITRHPLLQEAQTSYAARGLSPLEKNHRIEGCPASLLLKDRQHICNVPTPIVLCF
jgi:hypothetical protein